MMEAVWRMENEDTTKIETGEIYAFEKNQKTWVNEEGWTGEEKQKAQQEIAKEVQKNGKMGNKKWNTQGWDAAMINEMRFAEPKRFWRMVKLPRVQTQLGEVYSTTRTTENGKREWCETREKAEIAVKEYWEY